MPHMIFINLPIKDLKRSTEFFTKLGFSFNQQFTDDKGTCLVIDEKNGIFAMLLLEKFFQSFIPNMEIADSAKTKETLIALSVDSKEAVDEMMEKGLSAGGKEPRPTQDLGFMYGRALQDLDNHIWEIFWMNPDHVQR